MHIPDGYLDPVVCIAFSILSMSVLAYCTRKYLKSVNRDVSMLSVMAGAIFAAQMLNWPIPGGTSAHLVGGALASMIIGPFGGALAMFLNLLVQCILMGDGGITALGANVFNMAIVDVFVGYWVYRLSLKVLGEEKRVLGAFLGGWIGITLAAAACGLEIGLSPQFGYPISITVPVMTAWHMALGLIEGAITALVISYLAKRAPDVLVG